MIQVGLQKPARTSTLRFYYLFGFLAFVDGDSETMDGFPGVPCEALEWFSKRTGTSFQNGVRSKNVEKKLGRERRRVVLKSDLAVVSTNRPHYICS